LFEKKKRKKEKKKKRRERKRERKKKKIERRREKEEEREKGQRIFCFSFCLKHNLKDFYHPILTIALIMPVNPPMATSAARGTRALSEKPCHLPHVRM